VSRPDAVVADADGGVGVITINRPQARNAVNGAVARGIAAAVDEFDAADQIRVIVLTGAGGAFCAGMDLKAFLAGDAPVVEGRGFAGITERPPVKPVIAAVEGYAVGGGLELALWCDLRVAADDAVFGVFNRRFGVPLIDAGTVRLPRLIGQGRALDLILTGRPVAAVEAYALGLVERLVPSGAALEHALALAREIAGHPQAPMRADRRSVLAQWSLSFEEAMRAEHLGGLEGASSEEAVAGARRFAEGQGRHGAPARERQEAPARPGSQGRRPRPGKPRPR
jgi:enoyl-CoA hydratase